MHKAFDSEKAYIVKHFFLICPYSGPNDALEKEQTTEETEQNSPALECL